MMAFERMLEDDEALAQLAHANEQTRAAIAQALREGVDLGVSVAIEELGPVGFDFTLVNIAARDWTATHGATLIAGIEDTTAAGIRASVAAWIENGEPLEALVQDLERYYGRSRAEMIAATETTAAYFNANVISWRETGVVGGMKWQTAMDEIVGDCPICGPMQGKVTPLGKPWVHPNSGKEVTIPGHPRCRCWAVPVIEEDWS